MSVRSEKTVQLNATDAMTAAITEAQPTDSALAEHAAFNTNNAENPLTRSVVVSVRASLNELCLQKQKGTWAPSAEAMRSIMQSRKYTGLDGSAEAQGDLKSVVLHKMAVSHVKSTFPMSLGARITGVDDKTYSSTGESFSNIVLPHSESNAVKELQADDVSLGKLCLLACTTHFSRLYCDVHFLTPLVFLLLSAQPTSSRRSSLG